MTFQRLCFKCGERGHKPDVCIKINLVSIPCLLKPGRIGNKDVQLFMDSGADSSIIARELSPDNYTQCMPINVTGVNSQDQPTLCQTALFPATIDGHDVQMFAAVVDGKNLPHPVIIGRSIPGLNVRRRKVRQENGPAKWSRRVLWTLPHPTPTHNHLKSIKLLHSNLIVT